MSPDELARAAERAAERAATRRPDPARVGAAARALAVYAARGLPALGWDAHGAAARGLRTVTDALGGVDDVDEDLALVLLSARARVRLSWLEAVTARELAALAGVTPRRVRQLVAAGELPATDGRPARVAAEDAKRWLAARGVAGLR